MLCRAIDSRSHAQCERRAVIGEQFCSSHKRSRIPRKPSLPPDQRTSAFEMVGEIIACSEPVKKPPPSKRHTIQAEYDASPEDFIIVCGDRITPRCTAMSKRSRIRCKAPAVRGRKVCRFHGGKCHGPVTQEGKQRSGFQPVHGRETVAKRAYRSQKAAEFRVLKRVIKEHGL
jgi:hypothetical protein